MFWGLWFWVEFLKIRGIVQNLVLFGGPVIFFHWRNPYLIWHARFPGRWDSNPPGTFHWWMAYKLFIFAAIDPLKGQKILRRRWGSKLRSWNLQAESLSIGFYLFWGRILRSLRYLQHHAWKKLYPQPRSIFEVNVVPLKNPIWENGQARIQGHWDSNRLGTLMNAVYTFYHCGHRSPYGSENPATVRIEPTTIPWFWDESLGIRTLWTLQTIPHLTHYLSNLCRLVVLPLKKPIFEGGNELKNISGSWDVFPSSMIRFRKRLLKMIGQNSERQYTLWPAR